MANVITEMSSGGVPAPTVVQAMESMRVLVACLQMVATESTSSQALPSQPQLLPQQQQPQMQQSISPVMMQPQPVLPMQQQPPVQFQRQLQAQLRASPMMGTDHTMTDVCPMPPKLDSMAALGFVGTR